MTKGVIAGLSCQRFEGIFGGKIDKTIAFEEVLVLSGFMCKSSQVSSVVLSIINIMKLVIRLGRFAELILSISCTIV